jgi:hypothetical protein
MAPPACTAAEAPRPLAHACLREWRELVKRDEVANRRVAAMAAKWEEVDGVPALCAAEGEVQGPLHACLMFGTGRSDETLKIAGINHVVEHLVLHGLGQPQPYTWNGQVDPVATQFWAVGSPDQVVDFFAFVVRQLGELPVDRLADELRVLQIEGRRQRAGHLGADLSERYGPHGAGLVGWPEYGLGRLDAEEVVQWAQTRFTAQNAVMWISGPPPPALHVHDLPVGAPVEHLPLPSPVAPGRAVIAAETQRISLSLVSEAGWGINPIMEFARQRAMERLRRTALSYSVEFTPVRLGGGHALKFLEADGAKDGLAEVAVELVDVVDELATSGPTDHEITTMREYQRQFRDHPQQILSWLDSAARIRLLDGEVLTPEGAEAIVDAQTPESMCDELAATIPTMLMVGPEAVAEHLEGWSLHTHWSYERVKGETYRPIGGREQGTLVVGPEGISWGPDHRRRITIRWDDVEACLAVDSGGRGVVRSSGSVIWIMPWNWQGGEELTELVDDAVDPLRRIRIGEGDTHYRDPDADGSPVDVRWLGTIAGARWNSRQQDHLSLVIDADGVFVLYGANGGLDMGRHLQEVRSADRDTLLAIDRRNRWIPQYEIAIVELRRKPWTRIGMLTWSLTIRMVDATKLAIFLTTDAQVDVARTQFPRLLGARFRA